MISIWGKRKFFIYYGLSYSAPCFYCTERIERTAFMHFNIPENMYGNSINEMAKEILDTISEVNPDYNEEKSDS